MSVAFLWLSLLWCLEGCCCLFQVHKSLASSCFELARNFSLSSSVVYSFTIAQPRSEWSVTLINFCLLAITCKFLLWVMCSFTLFSFSSVMVEKVVVVFSFFSASSWFPFFLKLKSSSHVFQAANSAAFSFLPQTLLRNSASFVSKVASILFFDCWMACKQLQELVGRKRLSR